MPRVIQAFAQFFDGTGAPLENGWLKFLVSGTNSTLKNTYADSQSVVANSNPLQLDAEGRCPSVFGEGDYRVISYENNPITKVPGTQIQVFDPVTTPGQGSSSDDQVLSVDAFGTDNVLVKTNGSVRYVQSTGISVDDSDNVSGIEDLSVESLSIGDTQIDPSSASSGQALVYNDSTDTFEPGTVSGGGGGGFGTPQNLGNLTGTENVSIATSNVAYLTNTGDLAITTTAWTASEYQEMTYIINYDSDYTLTIDGLSFPSMADGWNVAKVSKIDGVTDVMGGMSDTLGGIS